MGWVDTLELMLIGFGAGWLAQRLYHTLKGRR